MTARLTANSEAPKGQVKDTCGLAKKQSAAWPVNESGQGAPPVSNQEGLNKKSHRGWGG